MQPHKNSNQFLNRLNELPVSDRILEIDAQPSDLFMRGPRNWTAIAFFGGLSLMHFSIAIPSFFHGHWEGYMSLIFAVAFAIVSTICWIAHYELAILGSRRMLRTRTGYHRFSYEQSVPFAHVRAVRLTMMNSSDPNDSRIEILCDDRDVDCPPSRVPREQALCLALALGVELIRVSSNDQN